ncbi:hypothetical protein [Photobacterium damselae]|uniref:hypothetical protein n=1 Tax=Photobacterium damselae TaxID=38293 RepID=UPI001F3AA285|nr:hypothetical protein [Photobacterium damselae]UKA12943.1 hypothetical protein IHC91_21395 [Photobacterium damselae subsp. damselae]
MAGLAEGFLQGWNTMDRYQRNNRAEKRQKERDAVNDQFRGLQMEQMKNSLDRSKTVQQREDLQHAVNLKTQLNSLITELGPDKAINSSLGRKLYREYKTATAGQPQQPAQAQPQTMGINEQINQQEIKQQQQQEAKAKTSRVAAAKTQQAAFLQNGGDPNDPQFRAQQAEIDRETFGTPLSAIKFKPEYRQAVDSLAMKMDKIDQIDPDELLPDVNTVYQENLAKYPMHSKGAASKKISSIDAADGKSFKFEITEFDQEGKPLGSYYMQDPKGEKGDTTIEIENAMGDLSARRQAVVSSLTAPKEYATYQANRDITPMIEHPEPTGENLPGSMVTPDDFGSYIQNEYKTPEQKKNYQYIRDANGQTMVYDPQTNKVVQTLGSRKPVRPIGGSSSARGRKGKTAAPKTAQEAANTPGYEGGYVNQKGRPIPDTEGRRAGDIVRNIDKILSGDMDAIIGNEYEGKLPTLKDSSLSMANSALVIRNLMTVENLGMLKGAVSDNDMAFLKEIGPKMRISDDGFITGTVKDTRENLERIREIYGKIKQRKSPQQDQQQADEPAQQQTPSGLEQYPGESGGDDPRLALVGKYAGGAK